MDTYEISVFIGTTRLGMQAPSYVYDILLPLLLVVLLIAYWV